MRRDRHGHVWAFTAIDDKRCIRCQLIETILPAEGQAITQPRKTWVDDVTVHHECPPCEGQEAEVAKDIGNDEHGKCFVCRRRKRVLRYKGEMVCGECIERNEARSGPGEM
ncbi:MAG: hypothetical protein ACYTBJ_21730 [Planctomycetota bacterium]|jgi:hypothetical protein